MYCIYTLSVSPSLSFLYTYYSINYSMYNEWKHTELIHLASLTWKGSLPPEAESNTLMIACGSCSSHLSTRSHVKHPWPSTASHSPSQTDSFNWGWARMQMVQCVSRIFGAVQAVLSPSSRLVAATPV